MKLRSDSPFAKLSDADLKKILELSEIMTMKELLEELDGWDEPVGCSEPALERLLKRLRTEKFLHEAEESNEVLEGFAERAKSGRAREGALEAARQKLYEMAMDAGDLPTVATIFRELREEHEKDRALKVTEENAKLGWRKLEWQKAESAVRLLPRLRELLMAPEVSAEEKVARALGVLMERDAGGELLVAGAVERKMIGAGGKKGAGEG